jgi:pyruvate,orthophosphate dikinase
MQDTEFTVEDGRLYMLQTRSAKRPAQAAVRFAVDAVAEGLLDKSQALATIDAEQLDALLHPTLDRAARYDVLASGVAASPGAAQGQIVFLASDAVAAAAAGRHVVLVRPSTEADDVAGFHAAAGVLTSEGGKASHAALVARGMGVPAVTGAADLQIDVNAREVRIEGRIVLREGDVVTIDGTTGAVTTDDVPLVEPEMNDHLRTVLTWADELRRLDVRANADTPQDARKARDLGAEGIGLWRTEHMFFGDERREKMVRVILASETKERRAALEELLPLQQGDPLAVRLRQFATSRARLDPRSFRPFSVHAWTSPIVDRGNRCIRWSDRPSLPGHLGSASHYRSGRRRGRFGLSCVRCVDSLVAGEHHDGSGEAG